MADIRAITPIKTQVHTTLQCGSIPDGNITKISYKQRAREHRTEHYQRMRARGQNEKKKKETTAGRNEASDTSEGATMATTTQPSSIGDR